MSIDLNELLTLAEKATPGPWRCQGFPMIEPETYFGVQVGKPGNILFDGAKQRDAEYIAAANPAVVADIIKRLQLAEAMNTLNLQKLAAAPGDYVLATVNEDLMKAGEATLKGMGGTMKQLFPQQKVIFLADWLRLECLGEQKLRQLGLVAIEQQKGMEGEACTMN